MPRRDTHFLHDLSRMPWPVGVALGCFVLLAGFVIAPALLADAESPVFRALALALRQGSLGLLLWVLAGACWVAALVAFLGRSKRRRMLEAQRSLADVRALTWREFEQLVGEAFRRQGFSVLETGQGGADGGVDLLLQRDGKKRLVQCKQWKQQKVGVKIVREQFGLLTHHGAERAIIVSVGEFTPEARQFAEGKPIDLIGGIELADLIRSVQTSESPMLQDSPTPSLRDDAICQAPSAGTSCPRCGSVMVERSARSTGSSFWGCSRFPACRGTRPMT